MTALTPISVSAKAGAIAIQHKFALLEATILVMRFSEWAAIGLTGWVTGQNNNVIVLALLAYAGIAELLGAYDVDAAFSLRRACARLLNAWAIAALCASALPSLLKSTIVTTPLAAATWFGIGTIALAAVRSVGADSLRALKRQGKLNQRVAIYGVNRQALALSQFITSHAALTLDLAGIYDERISPRADDAPSLARTGDLAALISAIRLGQVDQVIIAMPWSEDIHLRRVVSALSLTPVRIRLAPDRALFAFPDRPFVMLGDLPMMTLFERPISGKEQIAKRLEDLVLASLFILLAAPLMLVAALAIKLDSTGPIFFRQPREGFNNQRFRIWKFRSMHVGGPNSAVIQQAKRRDPRITRVGRIIRRTSIDELPQLFNVLSGEMSLVGPRPHAPSTRAGNRPFPDVIQTYAARHKVKPGITGWAQVCGWRGETETEEKLIKRVEHDLYYIEHWSVGFDLYILARTALAVSGAGVY